MSHLSVVKSPDEKRDETLDRLIGVIATTNLDTLDKVITLSTSCENYIQNIRRMAHLSGKMKKAEILIKDCLPLFP
jgi:hypothetical protein